MLAKTPIKHTETEWKRKWQHFATQIMQLEVIMYLFTDCVTILCNVMFFYVGEVGLGGSCFQLENLTWMFHCSFPSQRSFICLSIKYK